MNNIEEEINKIRLELNEETKNMTSDQKKERQEKLLNKLSQEFDFKFSVDSQISDNNFSTFMIAEETDPYNTEKDNT